MSKTIDVRPEPEGWPPKGFGKATGGIKPPQVSPIVVAAGLVVGLLVLGFLFMAITGRLGFTYVSDQEVMVKVNYLTGDREVRATPGYVIFIPFVQEIYKFDRTSQKFTMEGNKFHGADHVPRLTVRASDGSNFWFETLEIQYEISPEQAAVLLDDSGPGDLFKEEWIKGYARSVLRDEFGRYTAVEAADPTTYSAASAKSKDKLNELLAPHGLRITRIITPKPKFDPEYELAIEQRKEADQEVERLIAKEKQLEQERRQRLAAVEKDKEIELQALEGDLVKALRSAEKDAIRVQKAADAYAIQRQREGEGLKAEMLAQARGLEAKYTKEAEGLEKQAQALEERGEVVVREALVQKLMSIRFTLIPYSRDPMPMRLEHEGQPAARAALMGESTTRGRQ